MPELPSGITISKIKNASSATRSGAPPQQTTVRFFMLGRRNKMVGGGNPTQIFLDFGRFRSKPVS